MLLTLLAVLAVAAFLMVAGFSRAYQAQQDALGNRWYSRGVTELNSHQYIGAIGDFRTALLYSRDNYDYQAKLAQALIGANHINEAYAYLVNLWQRQPEDGLVNLELARIAAQRAQSDQAIRYFHNAIYANWSASEEVERRDARLELIEYLLNINARAQADSELIALEANIGNQPSEQARAGDLFLRTHDDERALAAYRMSLKSDRREKGAAAGAGRAAFELAQYPLAQRYLQAAVTADPGDTASAQLLKTTELVLQLDPFQRRITAAQRASIVMEAFEAAGDRLRACGPANSKPAVNSTPAMNATAGANSASSQVSIADAWAKMKPRLTSANLQRDPDLVESAMELVFTIERQTSAACGIPTGADQALLLIARLHEGA